MKLNYSIDLDQSEQFVNIFILGVLVALKNRSISLDDAEGFIFKPFIADFFKQNISENLSELVTNGCELEDYVDLNLNSLDDRINTLISNLLVEISKKMILVD
ncbi:DUF3969 family protein [Acinetobacter sp. YH12126]|uniref:DUF3969 family protein n=1 Tax=Acinetobacter sp. YH12126 TaxID=2601111 RepID=UPI0015D14B85|nr:DUF3969 family protein [Acinetobacter sp. YH12126]